MQRKFAVTKTVTAWAFFSVGVAGFYLTVGKIGAPANGAGMQGIRSMLFDDNDDGTRDFVGVDYWLNSEKPLKLADLRGQVVLIDFWTYCCINCMHIFPDLKYLEQKYKDEPFVVVGVHSGKFDQEKDANNIRQAVLRHNIEHPVAVDSDYETWKAFHVNAWPTLVVIDPEGKIAGVTSGEGQRESLDQIIGSLLETHRKKGTLGKPMKFRLERESFTSGALEFPGKVLADGEGKRLFIADTNHHRVLVTDWDGKILQTIGTGKIGFVDGAFDRAQFHQPQGMALSKDGATLYVADTENHAVRAINLKGGQVETIAGTGTQSHDYDVNGPGVSTALSSPWDLSLVGDQLFIAMAGTHQIWVMDLSKKKVSTFAGTGRETRTDGPNQRAAFAQPSGLTSDGKVLYVADSEISTIRSVDVDVKGETRTVAGSGGLFDFGSADDRGGKARFQHPLGVALQGKGVLFVADTFNHLIRRVDLESREVTTWLGTGKAEKGSAEKVGFFEPGGISISGDTMFVADTNHHRIVAVDIPTKKVRVVEVGGK